MFFSLTLYAHGVDVLFDETVRLKARNRLLDTEIKELTALLREHETGLDAVMDRVRFFSRSVQSTILDLKRQHAVEIRKINVWHSH